MSHRLKIEHFGPVVSADVTLGDLTIFVGPQATGKSLTLQLLKLLIDTGSVHATLKRYGLDWKSDPNDFLDVFFGEGMHGLCTDKTVITFDGEPTPIKRLAHKSNRIDKERLFFIPAQRVLAMNVTSGWLRAFTDYRPGDPYVVREFSEKLRRLAEDEFNTVDTAFPQKRRLKEAIRRALDDSIFGGYSLLVERGQASQKRLVLKREKDDSLPFTVWSAGQREFVPLLLGAYQLLVRAGISRRDDLEWAVIEELEMGLHPRAISAVMLLVLDLLSRGYKVCLSTHSPHVLDVVWALQSLQDHKAPAQAVLDLFELNATPETKDLAEAALSKVAKVYFFERDTGRVRDISKLDPAADDATEAGWGGLTSFTERVQHVVADVVANADVGPAK